LWAQEVAAVAEKMSIAISLRWSGQSTTTPTSPLHPDSPSNDGICHNNGKNEIKKNVICYLTLTQDKI
jgi:hypothetical protein